MEGTVYDAFFKSPRFHLSRLETERFQNDAFSKGSTFETVFENLRFHHCFRSFTFSVDDGRKRIKKYPFSNDNTFSVVGANNSCKSAFYNNWRNSRALIGQFSLSINGQTHEFMTQRVRVDNVVTKFIINNRTEAWKTDTNLLNFTHGTWPL